MCKHILTLYFVETTNIKIQIHNLSVCKLNLKRTYGKITFLLKIIFIDTDST